MATDPFVAPRLGDLPRERQNLSPGVDYPPASAWEANRAGDLPTGQPDGPLYGKPGPNVGFATKLAHGRSDRMHLRDHEALEDALPVVSELGMRRAASFGRAPTVHDIDWAIRLMGYDRPVGDDFDWRLPAVEGAHEEWPRRREIVNVVPDELLRLAPDQLGEGVEEFRAAVRELATEGSLRSSGA